MNIVFYIILGIMLLFISYELFMLVASILEAIYGLILGYEIVSFKFLFIVIDKSNGKYHLKTRPFEYLTSVSVIKEQKRKYDNFLFNLFEVITEVLITVVLSILLYKGILPRIFSIYVLVAGYGILTLFTIKAMYKVIIRNFGSGEDALIYENLERIKNLLIEGHRPRDLTFTKLNVSDKNKKSLEYKRYRLFNYFHALDNNYENEIEQIICEFEEYAKSGLTDFNVPFIYELIYYYSYIKLDLEKAFNYYNKVSHILEKDIDVFGKRIYAYFLYYVKKDKERAYFNAKEGLKVIDKYDYKGIGIMNGYLLFSLVNGQ